VNFLYEWVDSDPHAKETAFSSKRTGKLFVAVMLASVLGGLPLALFEFSLLEHKRVQEQGEEQKRIEQSVDKMREAIRTGKAGEATRRLFGVGQPISAPAGRAPEAVNPRPPARQE
jgi:hypothetical protein